MSALLDNCITGIPLFGHCTTLNPQPLSQLPIYWNHQLYFPTRRSDFVCPFLDICSVSVHVLICVFWYRMDVGRLVLPRTHTYCIDLMDLFYHGITDPMNLALRMYEALQDPLRLRVQCVHPPVCLQSLKLRTLLETLKLVAQSLLSCRPVLQTVNVGKARRWMKVTRKCPLIRTNRLN